MIECCLAGVNVPTLRTVFLKHRDEYVTGGKIDKCEPALQLNTEGDVDGLICYDGQGFETPQVQQVQPDTGKQVFLSGDGTVNYQSLRHAATWKSSACDVKCFELPGCDHRGVPSDPRMLDLLKGVLGLTKNNSDAESVESDSDPTITNRVVTRKPQVTQSNSILAFI